MNKPARGHLKDLPDVAHLRELRTDDITKYQLGQTVGANVFKAGDLVDVIGKSKGRGFAGVIKRYGMAGGPATHGQSDRQRHVGSIGTTNTPGWVSKGKRMPGHMGNAKITIQNLRVVLVDAERNLVAVRGAVPGAIDGLLFIRKAVKQ